MRKTKKARNNFRMMHSRNGKALSPVEFYLMAVRQVNENMSTWMCLPPDLIAEQYHAQKSANNPLWEHQSFIARLATRSHGCYLTDTKENEADIEYILKRWRELSPQEQEQELTSLFIRMKWVNSAYHGLNDIFTAFDREYLNKQQGKDYLTPKDGVLKTLDDLSLSPHTWGAFSLVGHQDMGWHHPHGIGGGAIRDAQRHQGQATPIRQSAISDDALITAIESFKASHNGERRGLNKNLSAHFKVTARAIGNRLKKFCDENPTHDLTLFIQNQ